MEKKIGRAGLGYVYSQVCCVACAHVGKTYSTVPILALLQYLDFLFEEWQLKPTACTCRLCVPSFPAEAPCVHVVEFARRQVQFNVNVNDIFRKFSEVNPKDAEAECHTLFVRYGYTVPVKVETVNIGPGRQFVKFPMVKLSSWMQWLLDTGRIWRLFCGCKTYESMTRILPEFWRRWKQLYPSHDVFNLGVDLGVTIPYFTHQDEGRGLKKEAIWIFSAHACIGRGTRDYISLEKHLVDVESMEFGLNFCGSTWATHCLLATMQRNVSARFPDAINKIMEVFAQDASDLARTGLVSGSGGHQLKIHMVHLNTKGDLPALAKIGNLSRSFSHVPRASSSRKPSNGICHYCLAGQEANEHGRPAYPYEDFSYRPAWFETLDEVVPWETPPRILQHAVLDPMHPTMLLATDIWRNFHLGAGKHWLASSFVSSLERLDFWEHQNASSVEARFQWLTNDFKQYCKDQHLSPHMDELSRASLCFISSKSSPVGQWSKGSVTTHFMKYLQYFCEQHVIGKTEDEVMLAIVFWINSAFYYLQVMFHFLQKN